MGERMGKRSSWRAGVAAAGLTGAVLLGAACQQTSQETAGTHDGRRAVAEVEHVAPLARALPADALAYIRVPSLSDLLLQPRGDGLTELKISAVHQEVADALLAGLKDDLLGLFEDPRAGLAGRLLSDIRSPIELVLLAAEDEMPMPSVLVRATLAGFDRASFSAFLETLSDGGGISVRTPLDNQGHALLNAGLPLFLHFDEASGVLHLMGGTNASRSRLDDFRTGQYDQSNRLAEIERGFDDSGRHLAVWVDIQRWWPIVAMTQPSETLEQLQMLGLDQARSLWIGLSSRNGRAASIARLEMPLVGFRTALAPPRPMAELEIGPEVSWAARIAVPQRQDIESLIDWIEALQPGVRSTVQDRLTGTAEYLGFEPMLLLDAAAPDLLLVSDAAGFYAAYGKGDAAAVETIKQVFLDRGWATTVDRSMNRLAITELRLSGTALIDEEVVTQLPAPLPALLPRLGSRSFVVEERDYRVTASVPQVLADRAARPGRSLAGWLAHHDVDWNDSIVAVLAESDDAPRDVYHAYLQLLSLFASSVDAELDLTRFPTAPELELPRAGRLGFKLDSTYAYLEARFDYETTPFEALLNTNIVTWYVAGVVAAVAIPAYQEYQLRAAGLDGGNDSCEWANDGECDEPDVCASGTDTTDCAAASDGDSCIFANDGECDEPDVCASGTDTTDCRGTPAIDVPGGPDSCVWANDGECDEPDVCASGTDTTDCSAAPRGPDSCSLAGNDHCDEPMDCRIGTDTTDCEAFPPGPDSCPWARDGECDEPDTCRAGTDTTDCTEDRTT
jgi:hypothetical protein